MKKRTIVTVLLILALGLFGAFPAFGEDGIKLIVNGDTAEYPLITQNGVSMVSVEAFSRLAGVDVGLSEPDTISITEQGRTLQFTAGKKEAVLDGRQVDLPCPPVKSGENIFIPLRFTADAFGFTVSWNGEKKAVELNRTETREGMTPSELLAKANGVMQDINTYRLESTMNMEMEAYADGERVRELPQNMTTTMSGQIQYQPMKIYMKQEMDVPGRREGLVVETYMTEEKMYIKAHEKDWIVQDIPFSPEILKEQQDIQSDPVKAVAQMKEMGMLLNYGNDVRNDGQEYFVVNATIDQNKFMQGYQNMMQRVLQGFPQGHNQVDGSEFQQVMQQLTDSMEFDYYYTVYINKETLVTDIISYDARVKMDIDFTQLGKDGSEETPDKLRMEYHVIGEMNIFDLGQPFEAPDVSGAQRADTLE